MAFVGLRREFLVLLAVPSVGQSRTAGMGARSLGFVRHELSFGHEKTREVFPGSRLDLSECTVVRKADCAQLLFSDNLTFGCNVDRHEDEKSPGGFPRALDWTCLSVR